MKQILQHLKTGDTMISDVPAPGCSRGRVLIRTTRSLISAGTERMLVEFSRGGLLSKARSQPDKVKQVLDKIRTDGLLPTLDTVFKRLDEPLPLGYCNVGVVLEVGAGVTDLKPGDRVTSNGPHAEIVSVPRNLCARIPDGVSDEAAAFTVLGSIGLQGVRLLQPTLGERVVVVGAGLIGLVIVQLLRASGCEVLAVDIDEDRLALAAQWGAATCVVGQGDPVATAKAWTGGDGVDGVIITASAKSDEIVHQAAEMCRKRGRIILVGVVGLNLRRADFYEKELTFQVSCSYGPGRYDDSYEQEGRDYPLGFVRWTEQRNFEAVLGSLSSGFLDVEPLISDRVAITDAGEAYDRLAEGSDSLGVILEYPAESASAQTVTVTEPKAAPGKQCVLAMIGAGNFAKMVMAPDLKRTSARLKYVAARSNGAAAAHLAQKYGFEQATTDLGAVLADDEVNAVFITTGHDSHAELVCRCLEAEKHVFVEKPLALDTEGVRRVIAAQAAHPDRLVMVGFNRRFSPHAVKIRSLLAGRGEPLAMSFTANAGIIPPEVWVHDPVRGGGRIIGEACHFLDLLSFFAGSPIASVAAMQMGSGVAVQEDKMSISISFADGSVGTVNYFGNGAKSYPKEQLEIYSEGRVLALDNFKKLVGHGFSGFRKFKTTSQDKGHSKEFEAFVAAVTEGGPAPIPLSEAINATLASFAAVTAAAEGRTIHLETEYAL